MKPVDPFPKLLHAFFYEWMVQQRNASAHTVRSYRDTWRLFLRFVAQRRRRTVAQLILADLTAQEVSAFLHYTEQERGDTIGTRNCRLAGLRSFFGFVAGREPTAIAQCAEILLIPTKRAPIHAPCYLEPEEVKAILAQPDRTTIEGLRDHALLSFLYNTGARIQEALDVSRRQSVSTRLPVCAFTAKAERTAVPAVAGNGVPAQIAAPTEPRAADEPIFVNRYGVPLGASGVRSNCRNMSKRQPRSCRAWRRST